MAAFRATRVTDASGFDLSFIGEGSGFEVPPTEDGNWFTRGALTVFEYRFRGERVSLGYPVSGARLRRQRPEYQPASAAKRS